MSHLLHICEQEIITYHIFSGVDSWPFIGTVCDFNVHTTLPFIAIPSQNNVSLSLLSGAGALLMCLKVFFLKHVACSIGSHQLIVIMYNLRRGAFMISQVRLLLLFVIFLSFDLLSPIGS